MPKTDCGDRIFEIHSKFAPRLQPTSSTLVTLYLASKRVQNAFRPTAALAFRPVYASPNSPAQSRSSLSASCFSWFDIGVLSSRELGEEPIRAERQNRARGDIVWPPEAFA